MKKKLLSLIALAALGGVSVAHADGRYDSFNGYHSSFDYTYLGGGYNYTNDDFLGHHGDGGYVNGSFGLDKLAEGSPFSGLFVTGSYGEDHFGANTSDHFNFGLNYHTTIARNLDLVGGAAYIKDFSHQYGVAGDLGVRYKLTRKLEFNAGETYTGYTVGGLDHKWTTHGGAVYSLWRNVALTGDVDYNHVDGNGGSGDYTVLGVGARVYF